MESAIDDIDYFIKQYRKSQFDYDKRKYWLCLSVAIKELEPTSVDIACAAPAQLENVDKKTQLKVNEHLFRT